MRTLAGVAAALGALALAAAALCGILHLALDNPSFPGAGEIPAVPESRYRVAVLGDSQKGLRNLANLLREIRKENVRFILHTGDLVSDNDDGHYRLAALALRRGNPGVPFLAVPGNHDVKGGYERFERRLGPPERAFVAGRVAFVLLDNALGAPPDPSRIERRLATLPPHEVAVLAFHVPPFDARGNVLPGYEPFLEWLKRAPRVRYALCGHVHDYVRREVGNAILIANGVGGDYESWQLRQKVYATILEVDGDRIADRTLELSPEHGLVENLEHLALGHVAETFRGRPVACWSATALVALGTGLGWGFRRLGTRPARIS
ncbi:MAG: metallophosphoesterase family protein [Planctomycetota bacterium]